MRDLKRAGLVSAVGALLSANAFAQSSVTLYGLVDQSIRYTSNADASNHGRVQLTNGAITNSRWGLRGVEDLGNNLQAIFQLENGFDPDTGNLNQGRLFGRQAWVGLTGDFGALKLGRQYTEFYKFELGFDPLTLGNNRANVWAFQVGQFRSDNVVSYERAFGGLNLAASYGFGEVPGSMTRSQYWGTRATYQAGAFSFGGVYQEFRDANSNKQQTWTAAGTYSIGPTKLFLGYVGAKDHTGVTDATRNADPTAGTVGNPVPAGGNYVTNPRKDTVGYFGASYQATPTVMLKGVFYYDDVKNANGLAGNSGKRYGGVLLAEYSLSKRTQVYGTVDYSKVSGGSITELPGKSNQTGLAIGLRHVF